MTFKTLAVCCLLGLASLAQAQVEQVKIMAPANPGGGFDTVARTLGEAIKTAGLAKNIVVENKAGAGGTIGMAQFINSEKSNPYALLVAGAVTVGAIETNKSPVNFSMLTPVARLMGEYNVLVVPASSPYNNLKALVSAYKTNPGAVSIGGGSAGGIDHIMAAMVSEKVGVSPNKLNYIPFAGGGEGKAAILGGQIAAYISGYGELADLIKSGKVKALALSADKKQADIPVPTFKEQGVNVVLYNWRGVFAPASLNAAQKQALGKMVDAAVKTPTWKEKSAKLEWLDLYQPSQNFAPFLNSEIKRINSTVKTLNLGS